MGSYVGDLYYFDFTSSYPYVGTMLLPTGVHLAADFTGEPDGFITFAELKKMGRKDGYTGGFFRCLVTGSQEMLGGVKPLVPVHVEEGLIQPYIDVETELYLPMPMIQQATEMGYEIKILNGYRCKEAYILKDCFRDLFKMKRDASAKSLDALTTTVKILINSLYGIWGFD